MPLPSVWGPIAWKLLHSIGFRAGKASIPKLRVDELREATWLINHLEYIIPCAECRQHIQAHRKKYPLPQDSLLFGAWLWTFHEAVNERLGKAEGPPFTQEMGKGENPSTIVKDYKNCVKESFIVGHLNPLDFKEWIRHFNLWIATV